MAHLLYKPYTFFKGVRLVEAVGNMVTAILGTGCKVKFYCPVIPCSNSFMNIGEVMALRDFTRDLESEVYPDYMCYFPLAHKYHFLEVGIKRIMSDPLQYPIELSELLCFEDILFRLIYDGGDTPDELAGRILSELEGNIIMDYLTDDFVPIPINTSVFNMLSSMIQVTYPRANPRYKNRALNGAWDIGQK